MRRVFKTSQNSQHLQMATSCFSATSYLRVGTAFATHSFTKEHWLKATFLKPTKNLLLFLVYVYRDKSLGPFLTFTFKPCTASYTYFQMFKLLCSMYSDTKMFSYKYLHAFIKGTFKRHLCVVCFEFNSLLFVRP